MTERRVEIPDSDVLDPRKVVARTGDIVAELRRAASLQRVNDIRNSIRFLNTGWAGRIPNRVSQGE